MSTKATVSACPVCAAPTLEAVDDGLSIRAELAPLELPEEVAALLDGRATFDVRRTALGYGAWLEYRDAIRIARGEERGPVVAEHRCAGRRPERARLPKWPRELAAHLLGSPPAVPDGPPPF